MKRKSTAILLALLLGGLGAHRFYLGQSRLGGLYLLFCWTLVPVIIGWMDGIALETMPEEQFNMKYNAHFWS